MGDEAKGRLIPAPDWQRAMDAAARLDRIMRDRRIPGGAPHAGHGVDGPAVLTVSTSGPTPELIAAARDAGLGLRVTHPPIFDLRRSEWAGADWRAS